MERGAAFDPMTMVGQKHYHTYYMRHNEDSSI